MSLSHGDIVPIGVPYVGSPGAKVRPALVVQNDALNRTLNETIIAAITSNLSHAHQPHQLLIDVSTPDGKATGLIANSAIRCNRIHAVSQAAVHRVIGKLPRSLLSRIDSCLKEALGIP
jgi:mRNA-degrading endonuclease toxin of MazEF toxin-antitoxin module